MDSYEQYLSHEAGNVLPIDEALCIYNNLIETIKVCRSEDKDEFVSDLIDKASKYAYVRVSWELWDEETKLKEDGSRTIKHNAVIDAFNILARLINAEGIETPWRDKLGDNRKRIGDFACFMTYMVGINNR